MPARRPARRPTARRGTARRGALAAGLGAALVLAAPPAAAGIFSAGGLSFSDELGGFRILEVSGIGTLDDPIVVVEEVHDGGAAVLVVRGLSGRYGNHIGSHHLAGFALTKVVINRTATAWSRFEIELREVVESHSPYFDGLSFGQGAVAGRPFVATGFSGNHEIDEPYDSVVFAGGLVEPGEAATFAVVVTDTTPTSPLYVFQQPLQEVAAADARANAGAAAGP